MTHSPRALLIALFVALLAALPAPALAASQEQPTYVSMTLRDVPAREAFAALAEQTKIEVTYDWGMPSDEQRVSMKLIHEPFWRAFERIGTPVDFYPTRVVHSPGRGICVTPTRVMGSQKPLATCVDGLFFGTLQDLTGASPANPAKSVASKLMVLLRPEPKLRGMMWHSIKVDQLIDDSGRAIECKHIGTVSGFSTSGSGHLILNLGERPGPRRIGRLRVSGKVLAAARSEVVNITRLMDERPPTVEAAGFRIDTFAAKGRFGRELTLMMTRVGDVPEWMRQPDRLLVLQPVVYDAGDRRFELRYGGINRVGRTCRLRVETADSPPSVSNPPVGDPQRLEMEIPTDVAEYDVEFEFNNVTLN